jgi:uncharacterized Ntn-hydrolase superfamily protein
MGRPVKKNMNTISTAATSIVDVKQTEEDLQHYWNEYIQDTVNAMNETIANLQERVEILEKKLEKPEIKSINRVEKFNDEVPSTIESYSGMKMGYHDKITSMRNAIKILPPNMVVNGRQLKENVEAIVGFKVSGEMMDEAYEEIKY